MNTILIPTDFSTTSKNASLYAISLAKTIGIPKVVFYHFYEIALVYKPSGELDEEASIQPYREKSTHELETFVDSLGEIPEEVEIEMFQGADSVNKGIVEVSKLVNADLIVMGIKAGGIIKEAIIGSHSLAIAKKVSTPVLIVPATASFRKYEKITFLSDFKELEKTPVDKMRMLFNHGNVELSVLYLKKHGKSPEDLESGKQNLLTLLKDFSPVFNYKDSDNYTDDIIDYVSENNIDILIVVPKYHNLIDTLFNDHTKKLAFHSKVPLLIMHN